MSRTLDASQTRHLAPHLFVVNLVKITTYTNRAAKTGAESFYFADNAVDYDYGNTGTNQHFDALFVGIDALNSSINHLPSPGDAVIERNMTFKFDNAMWRGERLAAVLRANNIVNALIEYAQIQLPAVEAQQAAGVIDLTAMTGDEHTVFYRGIVRNVAINNADIDLFCETEIPSLADYWHYANAADVDPRDYGERYPMIFGEKRRAKCVSRSVGWATTTAQTLTATQTGTIQVSDASGFAASGTVKIGNEEMSYTASPSSEPEFVGDAAQVQTITISARGQNSTQAAPHRIGEVCLEMVSSIVYTVAGHASKAVDEFYIENPVVAGELVRVPSNLYTVDLSDTTTDTFTTTTVTFTQTNFSTMLKSLFSDVDFDPPLGDLATFSMNYNRSSAHVNTQLPALENDAGLSGPVNLFYWMWLGESNNNGDPESVKFYRDTASGIPLGLNPVTRVRASFRVRADSGVSGNTFRIRLVAHNIPGWSEGGTIHDHIFPSGDSGLTTVTSSWVSVPSGQYPSSFLNLAGNDILPWIEAIGYEEGSDDIQLGVEIEINFTSTNLLIEYQLPGEIGDATLLGATIGFGVKAYADVQGIVAPDATYEAASGELIESQPDVVKYLVTAIGGETMDAASLATSRTNLSGNKFALDVRAMGFTFAEVVARLGYESRSNIFPSETASGRVWKMLQANSAYRWPDPAGFLDTTGCEVEEAGRDLAELGTHYAFHYAPDSSRGQGVDAYRGVVLVTPSNNDVALPTTVQLSAAKARIGNVQAVNGEFRAIRLQATAEDIAGYIAHEGIDESRRVLTIRGLPWYRAYTLEEGDLRWIVPTWGVRAPDDPIFPHDDIDNWTASGSTIALDTTPPAGFRGSGALQVTSSSSASVKAFNADWTTDTIPKVPRDVRGRALAVRVWLPTATYDAMNTTNDAVVVTLGSAGGTFAKAFSRDRFTVDAWTDLVVPFTGAEESSSPDRSRITALQYEFITDVSSTGLDIWYDDARLIDEPVPCRLIEVEKDPATEHFVVTAVEVPGTDEPEDTTPPLVTVIYYQLPQRGVEPHDDTVSESFMRQFGARIKEGTGQDEATIASTMHGRIRNADGPGSTNYVDFEFPAPPVTITNQYVDFWFSADATEAVSVRVGATQGAGDVELTIMPSAANTWTYARLYTDTSLGDWVRLESLAVGWSDIKIFGLRRGLIDTAVDSTSSVQEGDTASGDATDTANAIDSDTGTYCLVSDGEYLQVDFPAAATFDVIEYEVKLMAEEDYSQFQIFLNGSDTTGTPVTGEPSHPTAALQDVSQTTSSELVAVTFRFQSTLATDEFRIYNPGTSQDLRVYEVTRYFVEFA